MKKLFNLILIALIFSGLLITSCDDDDNNNNNPAPPATGQEFSITSNITTDETWLTGNTYLLEGRIAVEEGATLTIEPGVVVKASQGSGANASSLIIARGATLMAMGTAASPIIMTTQADAIEPGQLQSPNLSNEDRGFWGGLIVLGRAPISDRANSGEAQIEGIPASDTNGLYGGSDPADNSGTIQYVSIRHTGADLGEGDEIQGLTLGGVGSGTTVNGVEIVGSDDDGIEIFGGAVNPTNILVWDAKDDSFDMDQAYTGTVDNFIAILGKLSDHGLELDGPEGSLDGAYTLKNGSLKGNLETDGGEYGDLRSNAQVTLDGIYFFNFKSNSDLELDNNEVAQNYLDGKVNYNNLEFNINHLTEGNRTVSEIVIESVPKDDDGNETETRLGVFATKPLNDNIETVDSPVDAGANVSAFEGWTWAHTAGQLSDFGATIPPQTGQTFNVTENITTNTTWTSGNTYNLEGRIAVEDGATLTIEAGVLVKASQGSGANASSLIIARGATLMAMGTATSPIIMTTQADQIVPGQITSPNLTNEDRGFWGGLIVLGKAPISDRANSGEAQIEGIPASDTNGLYGGTDPADNSGTIQYVSIRHTGADLGEGDEIQGLTLGGVGSGTTVNGVEIVGSDDDGIEIFGGAVNPTNILVWDAKDDSFDMDQAYSGTVDNFIAILGKLSDHGLELDGPEGSLDGAYTLKNGSLKGNLETDGGEYGDLRSNAQVTLEGIYFFNFKANSDLELDNNEVAQNYLNGLVNFSNLEFNTNHLNSGNRLVSQIFNESVPKDEAGNETETRLGVFSTKPINQNIVNVSKATNAGADVTQFQGWTMADAAGQLNDFTAEVAAETGRTFQVASNITENTTWLAGNTYNLEGRIAIVDGATLTIEPGVVVKASQGSGANASSLIVARGAKLNALGSASSPIIMTTQADLIQPGQIESPNLTNEDRGFWGGLIVLGKAPISDRANSGEAQIEGIPASDTNGLYGGTDAADNSGTIQYVSIRHTGADLGEGDEIQGLTLGGVGSGTTVNGVEIVGSDDDGIEIFGGAVNPTNILVWDAKDDSFDMDQAYSGTVDNFIAILGKLSDHGLELDGPEGSLDGAYTLKNGSLKGNLETEGGEYGDLRSNAQVTLDGIYFFNFKSNSDLELDNNGVAQNYLDGKVNYSNLQFNVSHLTEGNLTIPQIVLEKTGDGETALGVFATKPLNSNIEIVTSPTVGANKSAFTGWTYADAKGQLTDF